MKAEFQSVSLAGVARRSAQLGRSAAAVVVGCRRKEQNTHFLLVRVVFSWRQLRDQRANREQFHIHEQKRDALTSTKKTPTPSASKLRQEVKAALSTALVGNHAMERPKHVVMSTHFAAGIPHDGPPRGPRPVMSSKRSRLG